jgi:uncharacterized protein (TIGR02996 family)
MNATLTDGDAVLRAVLDEPDDDLPRLAYADWLEERGAPGDAERAEFIRAQLEMARGEPCVAEKRGDPKTFPGHGCRRCGLAKREAVLLDAHGRRWARDLAPGGARRGVRWWRGFVEAISLPCADFVAHAGALFAAQPVCKVTLTDKAPFPAEPHARGLCWRNEHGGPASEASLPAALWRLLPADGVVSDDDSLNFKHYHSGQAALDAVSAACVLYGRDEARKRRS